MRSRNTGGRARGGGWFQSLLEAGDGESRLKKPWKAQSLSLILRCGLVSVIPGV